MHILCNSSVRVMMIHIENSDVDFLHLFSDFLLKDLSSLVRINYSCFVMISMFVIPDSIAHGQTTFQSSTAAYGVSSRAVNGNKNTIYNEGSCTHTRNEDTPWWAVDLQWNRLVGEVYITNRGDCCGEFHEGGWGAG